MISMKLKHKTLGTVVTTADGATVGPDWEVVEEKQERKAPAKSSKTTK